MRNFSTILLIGALAGVLLAGCSGGSAEEASANAPTSTPGGAVADPNTAKSGVKAQGMKSSDLQVPGGQSGDGNFGSKTGGN